MTKSFKRVAVLLLCAIATICMAIFAGCVPDDNEDPNGGKKPDETDYATTTFVVTVLDENGAAVNGTTFGFDGADVMPVQIQFCSILPDGSTGMCALPVKLGENGKATIELSNVKAAAEQSETDTVELHVLNVEEKGYNKNYGKYKVTEIPTEISVTLTLKTA